MNSNSLFNSFLKGALGLTGIAMASLIPTPQKAIGAWGNIPTCPAEGNTNAMADICLATPEIYEIRFYELGFCTTSPLAGQDFSRATCEKAWESSAGEVVDLATFSFKGLSTGTTYRIPDGTYPHGYAIISNLQGIKGKVYFNSRTYYTNASGSASTDSNDHVKFTLDLSGLAQGDGCWDSPSTNTAGYGTTKAYLTDTNLVTATDQDECDAATRMIGSIQLASPVVITPSVKGYKLTWMIRDMGLWVNVDSGAPDSFGSGPFLPVFTVE